MILSRALRLCGALLLFLGSQTVIAATSAETLVEAPGPQGSLKGTMLSAAAPNAPVGLIIPGSGPTDRDGNNPLGVKGSPYKLLAEGLAAKGISSVRIDKRGMFASAGATPDANAVTIADYVSDLGAWTTVIRQQTGAGCVWLIGHSEGGLVALAAAQKLPNLCGLILVATPGRRMAEILREQLKANPANAPILDEALAAISSLEAGRRVDDTKLNPALRPLFYAGVQGFLIDMFAQDPAALIAKVGKPVLILQGSRDLQVHEVDAQNLKKADPQAKLVILANVNHVLKSVTSDDARANLATYGDPSLPLAPGVVDAVAEFIDAASHAR